MPAKHFRNANGWKEKERSSNGSRPLAQALLLSPATLERCGVDREMLKTTTNEGEAGTVLGIDVFPPTQNEIKGAAWLPVEEPKGNWCTVPRYLSLHLPLCSPGRMRNAKWAKLSNPHTQTTVTLGSPGRSTNFRILLLAKSIVLEEQICTAWRAEDQVSGHTHNDFRGSLDTWLHPVGANE